MKKHRIKTGDSHAVPLPVGVRLLVFFLAAGPFLHTAAVLSDRSFLNFGGSAPWNYFIYFAAAPLVAALLATRHERARFSLYIFLTCEAYRGFMIHSPALIALAGLGILYFQAPSVRKIYPRIDPKQVLARLRRRR